MSADEKLGKKISLHNRARLGARARDRRVSLGLSTQDLAQALEVSTSSINIQERRLNVRRNDLLEKKWEEMLQTPPGWLRKEALRASNPHPLLPQRLFAKTVHEEIIGICNWLSTPEVILRTFDEKQLKPKAITLSKILQMRYGVHGEENSTLEAIGKQFSLTRERIRQLIIPMTKRAIDAKFETPILDGLKEIIESVTPATVENMESATRQILGGILGLSCANRFSNEILGKSLADFTALTSRNKKFATMVTSNSADSLPNESIKLAIQTSKSIVRNSGMAQINQVVNIISKNSSDSLSENALLQAIQSITGFEWIDTKHGWFWFGSDFETRLVRVARKILSACQCEIHAQEIFNGMGYVIAKDSSTQGTGVPLSEEIPNEVFQAAVAKFKWLSSKSKNHFYAKIFLDPKDELSAVEKTICDAINLHKGVAKKSEIDLHVKATLNVADVSVNVTLSKSPVLIQPGRGLYAIRGRNQLAT